MKIGDIRIDGKKKWELLACHRCGGSGIWTEYHGECYRCGGVGFCSDKDWYRIDEDAVKRRAKYAEKKRAEAAEKFKRLEETRAEAWAHVKEKNPRVYEEAIKANEKFEAYVNLDDDAFCAMSHSEREKVKLDYVEEFLVHTLSDGIVRFLSTKDWVIDKAAELLAKRDEKRVEYNAAEDVPAGKVVITGEVLSVKFKDNGFGGGMLKALILDDRGFKVWGSLTKKFFDLLGDDDRAVGKRFSFEATVTPSDSDTKFGFYARPAKVELLK